jgi:hypothetical protein
VRLLNLGQRRGHFSFWSGVSTGTAGRQGLGAGYWRREAAMATLKICVPEEVSPMKETSLVTLLISALHERFNAVVNEPLPKRWVELIHELNELEYKGSQSDRRKPKHDSD